MNNQPGQGAPNQRQGLPTETIIQVDVTLSFASSDLSEAELRDRVRSAFDRVLGDGDLVDVAGVEMNEYSMDVLSNPASLTNRVAEALQAEGASEPLAYAVALAGLTAPSDFISNVGGSQELLENRTKDA